MAPDEPNLAAPPETAQERYLETLRRRVSWQTDAAARERVGPLESPPAEPPVQATVAPPARPRDAAGRYRLGTLERRVEEAAGADPERVGEWRYTLFCLREHAAPDGTLPERFDGLIEDVFSDLL